MTFLLLTTGNRPPPILSGHRYSPNFRVGVGGDNQGRAPETILEQSSNGLLGLCEGFLLAVTFGDNLWKRRNQHSKTAVVLDALDAATRPRDLDLPGFGFHAMKGDRRGQYAVTITRNWRITFRWLGEDAIEVDFEDYHGG
jgi:toxin HigB-1